MVNAVGGIDLGNNHLDGRGALDYVSFGSNAPAGYADRLGRQQNALRALLDKAASSGLLADPIQLFRLLDALSHAISVDETLSDGSLQELGLQMRGLRTSGGAVPGLPDDRPRPGERADRGPRGRGALRRAVGGAARRHRRGVRAAQPRKPARRPAVRPVGRDPLGRRSWPDLS